MDFANLAKIYGTPLYAYDFEMIRQKYLSLKNEFSARKSLICYALKANSNLSVLKFLANLGAGFDCVSIGEIKRAIISGAKSYKIIFSGVGKSDDEIKEALNLNILMLNLESFAELERVEKIAQNLGKTARISIRINPNIDPKTHPYISTGLSENKFGVDIQTAKKMFLKAKNSPFLEPIGIHFHIGSQLNDAKPIFEAANIAAALLNELKSLEIDIKFFDVGGGIGIRYNDENTINLYEYAQGILKALNGNDVTIICEPGRFIVGECGNFITSVLYEKNSQNKRFVIVNGAMNDLLRPSLYGAKHGVLQLRESGEKSLCDVVGPVCESGDFLAKGVNLAPTKQGDLLVVTCAGAYGFSMSSNYNSRLKVAEVAVFGDTHRLIRKRESFKDLIALEKDYLE